MKGNFAAFVLIVVGAIFLLSNLGVLNFSLIDVLRVWWPAVLIALGAALFFIPSDKSGPQDKR